MNRFFAVLLTTRLRWAGLLVLAALTALAVRHLPGLRTNFDTEQYFPQFDPERKVFDRHEADFPYEDAEAFLLVRAPDLFTKQGIERIRRLTEAMRNVASVVEVTSLTSIKDITEEEGTIKVSRFIPEFEPFDAAAIPKRVADSPLLAQRVLNRRGDVTVVILRLAPEINDSTGRRLFNENLARMVEPHRKGLEILETGLPVIRHEFMVVLDAEQRKLLPIAGIVTLVLVPLLLGTLVAGLLTFVPVILGIVWTLGMMAALDVPITVLTTCTPIVLLVVGLSDGIHFVHRYREELGCGDGPMAALVRTSAAIASACCLTSLTTSVGFLSIMAANAVIIIQFGWVTAIAVILTYVTVILGLPLLLTFAPAPRPLGRGHGTRLMGPLWSFVTVRSSLVLAGALLLGVLACWGALRTRVLAYMYDDMASGSWLRERIDRAERLYQGTLPLTVYVESKKRHGILEPDVLRRIHEVAGTMRSIPGVDGAVSIADYLIRAKESWGMGSALPATREEAEGLVGYLTLEDVYFLDRVLYFHRSKKGEAGEDTGRHFASAQIPARLPDLGSTKTQEIIAALRRFCAERSDDRVVFQVTGTNYLAQKIFNDTINGLARSLAVALVLISAVFAFLYRDVRMVVVALVVNLVPLFLLYGFFGWSGIPLKPSTVLAFCVTFGIAVDDTIHLLSRLGEERRRHPASEALRVSFFGSGRPIIVTSVVIGLGFVSLTAATIEVLAYLGLLTALTVVFALAADLFLLPVLIRRFGPR